MVLLSTRCHVIQNFLAYIACHYVSLFRSSTPFSCPFTTEQSIWDPYISSIESPDFLVPEDACRGLESQWGGYQRGRERFFPTRFLQHHFLRWFSSIALCVGSVTEGECWSVLRFCDRGWTWVSLCRGSTKHSLPTPGPILPNEKMKIEQTPKISFETAGKPREYERRAWISPIFAILKSSLNEGDRARPDLYRSQDNFILQGTTPWTKRLGNREIARNSDGGVDAKGVVTNCAKPRGSGTNIKCS